jgi:uncharacterized protein with FMN-binding domain
MTDTRVSLRQVAGFAGVAGMLALTGCAGSPASIEPTEYADGTYTAMGSYRTPENVEQISVTITLEKGVVSGVEVVGDPQKQDSKKFQGQFIGGIADHVIGKPIDEISVRRVSGSSLTSGGFMQALAKIREQAAL